MAEYNFHKKDSSTPPPNTVLPILQKLISAYKLWQEYLPNISSTSRYTLGSKIDSLFLEVIELLFIAGFSNKNRKLVLIEKNSVKFDLLKLFIKIFWEIKAINDKKYIAVSKHLNEVGKMLGGWLRDLHKNQARKITDSE